MKFIVIGLSLLFGAILYAQSDSAAVFILPKLKISQSENGKNVTYEFDKERNKLILNKNFLSADTNLYKYKVNIADINKVTVFKNSNIVHVFIISFAAGALLGYSISGASLHGGSGKSTGQRIITALICGGVASFIAGGIALLISPDKEYSLLKLSEEQKRRKLMEILKENKLKYK